MSIEKCKGKYEKHFQFVHMVDTNDVNTLKRNKKVVVRKKITEKDFEISEVEQLNSHMTPVSKASDVAEKLNLKRKRKHEFLMNKLAHDLNILNLKIEENIRISSGEVKAYMKDYKDQLSQILKSVNTPEVASYHGSVFHDIQKKADSMKSHQLQLVEELYEDLNKLENLRSKETTKIFQASFQKIEKTAYMLPYDIQSFIEHEALKMNQLMLNNRRCFEDLKLNLILVTEETFKSFMGEVFCIKDNWVRRNLQATYDEEHYENERESLSTPPSPKLRIELMGHELPLQLTTDKCYNVSKIESWFENVKDVASTVETYLYFFLDLHLQVLQAIRYGMTSDFDECRKSLLTMDVINFEERSIQPLIFQSVMTPEDDFDELELSWQNLLRNLRTEVGYIYEFLTGLGHLWTEHNERLCESKILIIKAIEKAQEDDLLALQDLEVKFNLSLDSLRQEYNKEDLDRSMSAVVASLDAIKEKLESNYINEVYIVEEFYEMMNLEADVLSSDIQEFLYKKNVSRTEKEELEEIIMGSKIPQNSSRSSFSNKILEFGSRINSIKFCKIQMKRALEVLSKNTRGAVEWKAEDWVNRKAYEIAMKYQTQMEIHHKRYERVRSQIYEVRLQEIDYHKQVFDEHKQGIEKVYETLGLALENFSERSVEKLDEYKIKVAGSVEGAMSEERAAIVKSIHAQILRQISDFKKDVASQAEQVRGEIGFKTSFVRQSNIKFMKSIKLFHENGNYDAEEAIGYINSLEIIDRDSMDEERSLISEANKRESEIMQKASDAFDDTNQTMSQLYEELKFNDSVKNVINACKADIQELTAALKADFEALTAQNRLLVFCTSDDTNFLSLSQDELWFNLINELYKNVSNLVYAVTPVDWSDLTSEEAIETSEESKSDDVFPPRKSQDVQITERENVGLKAKAEYQDKDFRGELFVTGPYEEEGPVYVNAICRNCWESMDVLQRLASVSKIHFELGKLPSGAFYKKAWGRSFIREDLLKPTYEEFGLEIFQNFHAFAQQCEQLWLHTIRDFLRVMGEIRNGFEAYFDKRIHKFAEEVAAALDSNEKEFMNCFDENVCCLVNELEGLEQKLLPLHGYPGNSDLLKSLEDEVVRKIAELELHWDLFIRKYKNELKGFRSLYLIQHREWQTLRHVYNKCRDNLFSDKLGNDLLVILNAMMERRGFVKKMNPEGSSEKDVPLLYACAGYNPTMNQCPYSYNLNLADTVEGFLHVDVYLTEIKKILQMEELATAYGDTRRSPEVSENLWMSTSVPVIGLCQRPKDFDALIYPVTKRMECRYREVKNLIHSRANFQRELATGWLDKWKANVARICQLYSVKYGDVDDAS